MTCSTGPGGVDCDPATHRKKRQLQPELRRVQARVREDPQRLLAG